MHLSLLLWWWSSVPSCPRSSGCICSILKSQQESVDWDRKWRFPLSIRFCYSWAGLIEFSEQVLKTYLMNLEDMSKTWIPQRGKKSSAFSFLWIVSAWCGGKGIEERSCYLIDWSIWGRGEQTYVTLLFEPQKQGQKASLWGLNEYKTMQAGNYANIFTFNVFFGFDFWVFAYTVWWERLKTKNSGFFLEVRMKSC